MRHSYFQSKTLSCRTSATVRCRGCGAGDGAGGRRRGCASEGGVRLGVRAVLPLLGVGKPPPTVPSCPSAYYLALVLGPAFMASNFGFAGSQGELPDRFWRELSASWSITREKLHLDAETLAAIEAAESIDPDDIATAWTKQRWWQEQVDARMEAHFKLNAPERLRALQALNAAHRATDISSLVGAEDGPI